MAWVCRPALETRLHEEREAEAILRSKWTRWAGDMATDHGKRYGHFSSRDLARFLDTYSHVPGDSDVTALVDGTFFQDDPAPEDN